jgi:hypothetical protein
MKDTVIGSEIRNPSQRFVYTYDFKKGWSFLIELINVSKEENAKTTYPSTVRVEGIPPSQYGTKSLLGERFADIEEKYDLTKGTEGFGTEGEEGIGDDFAGTNEEAADTNEDI